MYNKSVTKIGICRRQRRRPRRESNPYICDFSRGGLNVRSTRSHPNLAPRPQICLIGGNGFVCSSLNELNSKILLL